MSYIATEVHQSIGALLRPNLNHQETRAHLKDRATYKLAYLEDHLISDKQFLVGDSFTVADVYMFVCLRSSGIAGLDLTEYPKVSAYLERMRSMECITAAQARMACNPQMVL
jgi:glutathione S-transferase